MKTTDLKKALVSHIEYLKDYSGEELSAEVDRLINIINDPAVKVTHEIEEAPVNNSPVPHYDPETDGDYTSWLVSNNID